MWIWASKPRTCLDQGTKQNADMQPVTSDLGTRHFFFFLIFLYGAGDWTHSEVLHKLWPILYSRVAFLAQSHEFESVPQGSQHEEKPQSPSFLTQEKDASKDLWEIFLRDAEPPRAQQSYGKVICSFWNALDKLTNTCGREWGKVCRCGLQTIWTSVFSVGPAGTVFNARVQ